MRKIIGLLLSALMVVSLSACGEKTAPPPPAVSTSAAAEEVPAAEALTLYIGLGEDKTEVPCTVEKTPEAVIAALAAETGWNLSVQSIAVYPESLAVTLGADSSIYTDPPEPQKDAYHVFDAETWVYTVLDSVSETLTRNFNLSGITFASPTGGDVEAGNGFVTIHINSDTNWDYESVLLGNEPLPADSIGAIYMLPQNEPGQENLYIPGGMDEILLILQRPEVQIGSGHITVYNEDGSVFDSIATDRMEPMPATREDLISTHFKGGTCVRIYLNKPLAIGKTYFVSIDAGILVCGALSSKASPKEAWPITVANYGIVSDNFPDDRSKTVQVGQPINYNIMLGEATSQCEIVLNDPAMADVVPAKLTADGAITITPQKAGTLEIHILYTFQATGETIDCVEYVTVIE